MRSPILRLPYLSSVHMPNEPIGPAPPARPRANSSITPVDAMRMTNIKYGSRKVKPPHVETSIGKRHMFPIPTAEPMQAMIKPLRLRKPSRLCSFFSIVLTFRSLF